MTLPDRLFDICKINHDTIILCLSHWGVFKCTYKCLPIPTSIFKGRLYITSRLYVCRVRYNENMNNGNGINTNNNTNMKYIHTH